MPTPDQTVKSSMESLFGTFRDPLVKKTTSLVLTPPFKVEMKISRDGKKYPSMENITFCGYKIKVDENGYGELEIKE
jgi:hypothetical protein